MLRVLLEGTDKGDCDWVECGSCDVGWQVAHYAPGECPGTDGLGVVGAWSKVANGVAAITKRESALPPAVRINHSTHE